jgi:hypothetical protein
MRLTVIHIVRTLVIAPSIWVCAYYIILWHSSCMHYAMKYALQNDVKTTHQPKYSYIIFTIGFSRVILQSPPLIFALSSVHHTPIYNIFFKIFKKMWVFCPRCILILPISVLRIVPGPLNLYKPYGSVPELLVFSVQNVHQLHLKSAFFLHLYHIPINNMISIRYIFL